MALVNLPVNPSQSNATVGKDYLLYINTGSASVPDWTLVGGQRSSDLERSADSIDVSHKTSGGWKSSRAGLRGWSISLDALVLLSDAGLLALETAFISGLEVNIRLQYSDGSAVTGWGSITDFSMSTPHDDAASISGTIEGNGPLSERAPSITPLSVTVSKAAATDVIFTVEPSTTTLTTVKCNGNALTTSTNYTYLTGKLTIKSAYIGTLSVGNNTVEAITGDGAVLSVQLKVTA